MNQPCISIQTSMLDQIEKGEHVTLLALQCGRAIASRMTSLGFTPGVQIEMVQNYGKGPLVVNLRGTRVAIGRGEAGKIVVQKGETE